MDLRILDESRSISPGDDVELRLQIRNDASHPESYHVRVVGSGSIQIVGSSASGPVPPGVTANLTVNLLVPLGQAAGDHRIGVEVVSESGTTAVGEITLRVASTAGISLSLSPATVKGYWGGRYRVNLANPSERTVELELRGEGDDLDLEINPDRVELSPGERVQLAGRVRRSVSARTPGGGERLFTVVAQGHSTPVRATASFAPRAVVPHSFRKVMAIVVAMAVWAAALAMGMQFLDERQLEQARAEAQALQDEVAAQSSDASSDGAGDSAPGQDAPEVLLFEDESVDVGGVVDLGVDGDQSGVTVLLRPVSLTQSTPAADSSGGSGLGTSGVDGAGIGKVSALHAGPRPRVGLLDSQSTTSNAEGIWGFANLPAGQFELRFSRAGFVTQSYLISIEAGDDPIELEISMEAGDGLLAGLVTAGDGPVGGATVTITDGTVTYTTTTATEGQVGRWSVSGLETPGRYLITVDRRGYGAETQALNLEAGGSADALSTTLAPGVGSIRGSVRHLGEPVGGINISATDGEIVRETSSLTEIDVGSFVLPQLPSPGTYTLTVSGEGFVTQTLDVPIDGNESDVVIALVSSTAIIAGTTTDTDGNPVSGVSVIAFDGVRTYKTTSAIDPPGTYELTGVVPGTYVVSFDRFEYQPSSTLAVVAAGEVRALDSPLERIGATAVESKASVSVSPEDGGVLVTGATVTLQGSQTFTTDVLAADNTYTLEGLPVGTYVLTITHPSYQTVIQTVRLGPTTVVERTVALQALGDLFGVVTDSDGVPIPGATVTVTFAAVDAAGQPTTSSFDPLFTSTAGGYSIEKSLGAREYVVVYSASGHETATRTFVGETGTSTELNVTLFRQPKITGVIRYRNTSGIPVPLTGESTLRVEFRPAGSSDPWSSVPVSITDGSYELPSSALAVGSWELRLVGLPSRFASITTMPDTSNLILNEVRQADVVVPVNPAISGTVRVQSTTGSLQPVASVTLQMELLDAGTGSWTAVGSPVTSDSLGQYNIDSDVLSAGTWRLRATNVGAGNIETVTSAFTLALDTTSVHDLTVDTNPYVAITVKDKDLSTLSGITVVANELDPTDDSVVSTVSTTTDSFGVAEFTRTQLQPGRYGFVVSGSAGLQDELVLANQDLVANQILPMTAVLFPDPRIDGYVRRLNSSNNWVGESGWTVVVKRTSDDVTVATTTSVTGGYYSFDPDAFDPGDYTVVLGADDRSIPITGLANNEVRSVELIVPQVSTVTGTLFWLNAAGQRVDLDPTAGWSILAANTIIDHTASVPSEVEVRGDLTATGTGPGWSLEGQASGTANYVITTTDGLFQPATVPVTVAPGTDPASVDVELTPVPATIGGLVEADGLAVSGADVTLTSGSTVRSTTTGGDGTWALADLVPGTWTITVAKAGYQTAVEPGTVVVGPGETQSASTGQLNELRTVTVNVTSAGSALSGATVTLSPGTFTHTEPSPGVHVFTGVAEGNYSISVTKDGHAIIDGTGAIVTVPDVSVSWGADPAPIAVELAAFGSATGVLSGTTAGETNPLIGYTVTANLVGGSGPGAVVTATTEAPGGAFTLTDLQQGTWELTVTATGYVAPPTAPSFAVTWNGANTVIPPLDLAAEQGSISLVALSDNFEPAAPLGDVTVELRVTGSDTVVATATTPTGNPADGLTFPNLDAGSWTITMEAAGHADKTIFYVLARGELAVIDQANTVLESNSGGVVGTIQWRRSDSSTPVGDLAGATVLVTKNGQEVARIDNSPTPYSVSLLTNAKHDVTVSKPGFQTSTTEVNINGGVVRTADFVLVADPVSVTVNVEDDLGADLDGVALSLTGYGTYSGTTTGGGTAVIVGVQPDVAAYQLTATKDDYDPQTVSVSVAPGQAIIVPTITLNRQGSATLRVEDDTGAVLSGANVSLTNDPAHLAVYDPANSHFVFSDLPTGSAHGITVTASGHDTNTTTTSVVAPGGSEALPTLVLNRSTGSITVNVTDGSSAPLAGATIDVKDNSGATVGSTATAGTSETYPGLSVVDGPYVVTVTMSYHQTVVESNVAVTSGGTTVVGAQLADRPTLQVTVNSEAGTPADPSVTVDLRQSGGGFTGGVTQASSSPFVFANLTPSTYDGFRVTYSGAGYHPVSLVVPKTIDEGLVTDTSVTLIALGTIEVTVEDSGGQPLVADSVLLTSVTAGVTDQAPATGVNGVYTFTGLSAATDYVVTVNKTGYTEATSIPLSIVTTSSATVATTVTLTP